MATFLQIQQKVQARMGTADATLLTSLKRWINDHKDDIESYMWDWQLKHDFFETVDEYTTGTVTFTNGSATVTGSSTVWTAAMVGRKIKNNSTNTVYIITAFASATSITIDQNYIDDTEADANYVIFQDEYTMPYDCMSVESLSLTSGRLLKEARLPSVREDGAVNSTTEFPREFARIGYEDDASYSTGTISVTGNTTVTLVGGTWPSDAAGQWIRGDAQGLVFEVDTRDSDTVLTLKRSGMTGSAITYQLEPGPRIVIRMKQAPSAIKRVNRWYMKRSPDMVNDNDHNQMPEYFDRILVQAVYAEALRHQREYQTGAIMAKTEYERMIYRERIRQNKSKHRGRTPRMRSPYETNVRGSWI